MPTTGTRNQDNGYLLSLVTNLVQAFKIHLRSREIEAFGTRFFLSMQEGKENVAFLPFWNCWEGPPGKRTLGYLQEVISFESWDCSLFCQLVTEISTDRSCTRKNRSFSIENWTRLFLPSEDSTFNSDPKHLRSTLSPVWGLWNSQPAAPQYR